MLHFMNSDHALHPIAISFVSSLILSLITPITSRAHTNDWIAPDIVPDNRVLEIAQSRWLLPDGKITALGTGSNYYSDEDFNSPTDAFWSSVLIADTAGRLGAADGTDSVAMSYWPPFTVWFPTRERLAVALAEMPDIPDSSPLMLWLTTEQRVLVFDYSDYFDGTPDMVGIYFKLDEAAVEQPNHCHAQQIITILYTGQTDEVALRGCLLSGGVN